MVTPASQAKSHGVNSTPTVDHYPVVSRDSDFFLVAIPLALLKHAAVKAKDALKVPTGNAKTLWI